MIYCLCLRVTREVNENDGNISLMKANDQYGGRTIEHFAVKYNLVFTRNHLELYSYRVLSLQFKSRKKNCPHRTTPLTVWRLAMFPTFDMFI